MKTKTLALIVLSPLLASCGKQSAGGPAPAPSPAPAVAAAPSASKLIALETPAPAPAPVAATPVPATSVFTTPVPATPAPHELAPPGVFYLVSAVRIETSSGVTGLPPGTGVKLLHDNVYLTPAGEAHLDSTQITNDMTVAREVMNADRAAQAATQSALATNAARVSAAEAALAGRTPPPKTRADLEADRVARRARIAELTAQKNGLNKQLFDLRVQQGGEQVRAAGPRGHIIASSTLDQEKAVVDQIAAIDAEIAQLRAMR